MMPSVPSRHPRNPHSLRMLSDYGPVRSPLKTKMWAQSSEPLALEGAPAGEAALDEHHQLGETHPQQADDDDGDEQLGRGKAVRVQDDEATETADGGEELGHDHTDDGEADGQAHPGHDVGHGGGQHDLGEDLSFGGPVGPADLEQ